MVKAMARFRAARGVTGKAMNRAMGEASNRAMGEVKGEASSASASFAAITGALLAAIASVAMPEVAIAQRGAPAAPTGSPAAKVAHSPPPVACLPAGGPVQLHRLIGNSLELCTVEKRRPKDGATGATGAPATCFYYSLAGQYLSTTSQELRSTAASTSGAGNAPSLEIGAQSVEVCNATLTPRPATVPGQSAAPSCRTFTASESVDPGLGLTAELSPDSRHLVLSYLGPRPTVEIFSLVSGRLLTKLTGRERKALCLSADFIGPSLLMRERDCGEDEVRAAWLADRNGTFLAEAGGAKAFASAAAPIALAGDTFAFLSPRGDAVALQNVRTGAALHRVSLGAKLPAATAATLSAASDGNRLMIAHAGKRRGELSLIDVATGKLRKLSLKRCPK